MTGNRIWRQCRTQVTSIMLRCNSSHLSAPALGSSGGAEADSSCRALKITIPATVTRTGRIAHEQPCLVLTFFFPIVILRGRDWSAGGALNSWPQSAHARAANRGPTVCQPTASVLGTRTQSVHLASGANGQQEGKPGGLGPVLRPSCRSLDQAFSAPSTNEKSLRSSGEIMPSWIRCLKLINLFQ